MRVPAVPYHGSIGIEEDERDYPRTGIYSAVIPIAGDRLPRALGPRDLESGGPDRRRIAPIDRRGLNLSHCGIASAARSRRAVCL